MQIGFIGMGHLGAPIAENLLEQHKDLFVYNRTASKAKPLEEKEVDQQQTSSTGLLDIMKDLLSPTLPSTKSDVISSEEQILAIESEKQFDISSPVPGYFTSSDVYHAYKQPVEPIIEEKDASSIIDKATSIITDIISSVTSALTTMTESEEVIASDDISSSKEQ